jgi:predicted amidophosphoribosyltransferase
MAPSVLLPAGPPPGFPQCGRCPYVRTGPAVICVVCARRSFDAIGPDACAVCSQQLNSDGRCPNELCADPGRRISRIHAIAYETGPLRQTIINYKYEGFTSWAAVLGRLVLGWLELHAREHRPDLIVANPTFTRPGERLSGHTEAVLWKAAAEDREARWEFDLMRPPAIVKIRPTTPSADTSALDKLAAARELRDALRIPDVTRVEGRRILVYDDVCTTGSQLDEIAGCLLDEGRAAEVQGLVLARAPWRQRT